MSDRIRKKVPTVDSKTTQKPEGSDQPLARRLACHACTWHRPLQQDVNTFNRVHQLIKISDNTVNINVT